VEADDSTLILLKHLRSKKHLSSLARTVNWAVWVLQQQQDTDETKESRPPAQQSERGPSQSSFGFVSPAPNQPLKLTDFGQSGKLKLKTLFGAASSMEDQSRFVSRLLNVPQKSSASSASPNSLPLPIVMSAQTHCIGDSHASWVFRYSTPLTTRLPVACAQLLIA